MTIQDSHEGAKSRAPQRKWVAPLLTRFRAGLAENGFTPTNGDGQFTGS